MSNSCSGEEGRERERGERAGEIRKPGRWQSVECTGSQGKLDSERSHKAEDRSQGRLQDLHSHCQESRSSHETGQSSDKSPLGDHLARAKLFLERSRQQGIPLQEASPWCKETEVHKRASP